MQAPPENNANWPLHQKVLFRFFFIFLILFIVLNNNGAFPQIIGLILSPFTNLIEQIIPWVGKEVFNLSHSADKNGYGSGDNVYSYLKLFVAFSIAVIGCVLWSLTDKKRKRYSKLYYWLTVAVRFYVGLMLFNYGIIKIIKLQFPFPDVRRLLQPYGESSPMGLAWTYLGFSKGYNMFMGIAEVSALFLLFRRTMTFGLIITLMTTANVMAVNYFYDVPVKILSTMLVVMTLFLLSHDAKRLFIFFFTGRAIDLPVIKKHDFRNRWLQISKLLLKCLLIGFTLTAGIKSTISQNKQYGEGSIKSPYSGVYAVDKFIFNRKELLPLTTDSIRWKYFRIHDNGQATIKFMNDSLKGYKITILPNKKKIQLESTEHSVIMGTLYYERNQNGIHSLKGHFSGDSVNVILRKKNRSDFPLMKRGFNWISEKPYNR